MAGTPNNGTIIVTGANGGLGSAVVAHILASPDHIKLHGIYVVRNEATATTLRSVLDRGLQAGKVAHEYEIVSVDQGKLANVREFAAKIKERVASGQLPPIRAIIENAGWEEFLTATKSEDGLDLTFAVNYLSHWLMTMLLLGSMDPERGRIVVISSTSHDTKDPNNGPTSWPEKGWGTTIWRDLPDSKAIADGSFSAPPPDTKLGVTSFYIGFRRYGASKLSQLMMAYELQRRLARESDSSKLRGLRCVCVDPGAVSTGITRRFPGTVLPFLMFRVFFPLRSSLAKLTGQEATSVGRTAETSAGDILAAALDGEQPPAIFLDGRRVAEPNDEVKDERKAGILWRDTVGYTQLKEGETALEHWN